MLKTYCVETTEATVLFLMTAFIMHAYYLIRYGREQNLLNLFIVTCSNTFK